LTRLSIACQSTVTTKKTAPCNSTAAAKVHGSSVSPRLVRRVLALVASSRGTSTVITPDPISRDPQGNPPAVIPAISVRARLQGRSYK
jgi:hypothetical protein